MEYAYIFGENGRVTYRDDPHNYSGPFIFEDNENDWLVIAKILSYCAEEFPGEMITVVFDPEYSESKILPLKKIKEL